MDMWQGADEVVIVDAMHSKSEPGTVRVFKPLEEPLPTGTFASSHATGVAETIEMARRLGRLPADISVYGIEAEKLTSGTDVSPAVAAAVDRVVAELDHA